MKFNILITTVLLLATVYYVSSSSTTSFPSDVSVSGRVTEDNVAVMFTSWMKRHSKKYHTENEMSSRQTVFLQNAIRAEELQRKHGGAGARFHVHGPFADMTEAEFSRLMLRATETSKEVPTTILTTSNVSDIPTDVDWRTHNVVTDVKNQGLCGGCWAFSAAAALESAWSLQNKPLADLSPQQFIDCDIDKINNGCGGGNQVAAYQYLISNKYGLDYWTDYPFVDSKYASGDKPHPCTYNPDRAGAFVGDYVVARGNEDVIAQNVANRGPGSISVNATLWQLYDGGILQNCPADGINHAVTVVGYGVDPGTQVSYWVIKNSWGPYWGESGYIRLRKGSNECDVNTLSVWPIVNTQPTAGPLPSPTPVPPTPAPSSILPGVLANLDLHKWLTQFMTSLEDLLHLSSVMDQKYIFAPVEIVFGLVFLPFGMKLRRVFFALCGFVLGSVLGLMVFVGTLGDSSIDEINGSALRLFAVAIALGVGLMFTLCSIRSPVMGVILCTSLVCLVVAASVFYVMTKATTFTVLFATGGCAALFFGAKMAASHPILSTIALTSSLSVASLADGVSRVGFDGKSVWAEVTGSGMVTVGVFVLVALVLIGFGCACQRPKKNSDYVPLSQNIVVNVQP
eukprot:PhF_6_TR40354/c0_g1_i1/m.60039/K01373/CTSF; cathepsin F